MAEIPDPPRVAPRFPRPVAVAEAIVGALAGLIVFLTMVMTVIDVIGRYLFDHPLGFAYEMTELAMAVTFFTGLSLVTLRGEHISVGLFDSVFRGRVGAIRNLMIAILIAVCAGFLSWRLLLLVGRFEKYGDITNVLKLPIYPVALIGTIGTGLAALAGMVLAGVAARRLWRLYR
jgi:TRAP-type transport system small permease protein